MDAGATQLWSRISQCAPGPDGNMTHTMLPDGVENVKSSWPGGVLPLAWTGAAKLIVAATVAAATSANFVVFIAIRLWRSP